MSGKVYLVGAGPGDPELLTRKAWRVLQSADVVLHDDLVSEEILRILPPAAQIVNVGKRCGAKGISQDEINDWMVSLAREGKIVARLKSGDPLLFGRAGEEMEALRQAGIGVRGDSGSNRRAGRGGFGADFAHRSAARFARGVCYGASRGRYRAWTMNGTWRRTLRM